MAVLWTSCQSRPVQVRLVQFVRRVMYTLPCFTLRPVNTGNVYQVLRLNVYFCFASLNFKKLEGYLFREGCLLRLNKSLRSGDGASRSVHRLHLAALRRITSPWTENASCNAVICRVMIPRRACPASVSRLRYWAKIRSFDWITNVSPSPSL